MIPRSRVTPDSVFSGNRIGEVAQRAARQAAGVANVNPWANSVVLQPVTFTAGQTRKLAHGLPLASGSTPARWAVDDVRNGYGSFQRNAWDDVFITITSEHACTVTFRVGKD